MHTALTIAQVATCLQATVPILQAEVAALPAAIVHFHPATGEWATGEWSVNEVIGHLIETEQRGFAGRISGMLAQDSYVCQAWDQDQVARDRRDDEKSTTALLDELASRRAISVAMVPRLTRADLARTAVHPTVGVLSVNDLLHEWVFHDRNHIQQIMRNVQAWVWPSMGNAQRFTTG